LAGREIALLEIALYRYCRNILRLGAISGGITPIGYRRHLDAAASF
jgi:hypothetical protein